LKQEVCAVEPGVLYLVSTPIGNLRDLSFRALDVLTQVDLIAAEDTRRTRILLEHYTVHTPTTSYFDHNKERKTPLLLNKLRHGVSIALVSDAGTPGISDPAFYLVRAVVEADLTVQAIPGPTAMIAALILSGLATDRFVFEGFLPVKKGRLKRLEALSCEPRTIILYESPQRLMRTLCDIKQHCGSRNVAIAREITKRFEECLRGNVIELIEQLENKKIKGEIVLVVEGLTRRSRNVTRKE